MAHLCFGCKHFKQYQPLTFTTPGECRWEAPAEIPEWLANWLSMDARYHGPARVVYKAHPPDYCAAFSGVETPRP